MMLDHMKTCSVGTGRGGVSRTVMISPTKLQASPSISGITTTSTPTQPLSKEVLQQQQTQSMQLRNVRMGQDEQQPKKDVQLHDIPKRSSSYRMEHPSLQIEPPDTVPKLRENKFSEELQLPSPRSPKKQQPPPSPSKLSITKPNLTTQSVTVTGYRRKEERGSGFESVEYDAFDDEDDDAGVCSSGAEEEDESEVVSPDVRLRKAVAAAKAESLEALHSVSVLQDQFESVCKSVC